MISSISVSNNLWVPGRTSFLQAAPCREATQKFGAAIIRVIAATKELALQALSSIRIALLLNLNAIYITNDDPPRMDHAHLNALASEDQSNIIDAAVTAARAEYRRLFALPSSHLDVEVEFGNQKKSVRFADALGCAVR